MSEQEKALEKRLASLEDALRDIASALNKNNNPLHIEIPDAPALVFDAEYNLLHPVKHTAALELALLKGIDAVRDQLLPNSERFARGLPANNALLWGSRGMGKSSLVKAVHRHLRSDGYDDLTLVEIHREDISAMPTLLRVLAADPRRFLLFCDDLSFSRPDQDFKALKTVLEGGIEGRPDNVLFYATANRRHLLPRDMAQNEKSTAINPGEAVEETVALSDRFGLWLGFYPCDQDTYLKMIEGYMEAYDLDNPDWRAESLEWATTRGGRSGRVAWQYIQDLAGRLGKPLG